jgi:hypothetical protein
MYEVTVRFSDGSEDLPVSSQNDYFGAYNDRLVFVVDGNGNNVYFGINNIQKASFVKVQE